MFGASAAAFLLCALCWPLAIRSEGLAGFDAAIASSVYSAGFSAEQALREGSGYWCRFCPSSFLAFFIPMLFLFVTVREAMPLARALLGRVSLMLEGKQQA